MQNSEKHEEGQIESKEVQTERDVVEADRAQISSPVIARLIEEVRNEEPWTLQGYNRFHNRHNR